MKPIHRGKSPVMTIRQAASNFRTRGDCLAFSGSLPSFEFLSKAHRCLSEATLRSPFELLRGIFNPSRSLSIQSASSLLFKLSTQAPMFSQNHKNLWSRANRTVVHEQNLWLSCEFINCPCLDDERDQDSRYALLKNRCTRIRSLAMFRYKV